MTALLENTTLTAKSRERLKDSDFALPEDRAYPIHNTAHARNALARVSQHGTPEEKARVRKAIYRKYPELSRGESGTVNSAWQTLTVNLDTRKGRVRIDYLEGRKCYVVPVVMLTEGVHNGSNGPLYYPPSELGKTPVIWNHKPIVVYHPQINGRSVSACDKTILESRKVGILLNTRFERKLKSEAWLYVDALGKVDKRVLNAVEKGDKMEVSTGLFTDNEGPGGEWKGERYVATARNYRPDHLAILPDQKGSCSISDGAGLNMNAEKGKDHRCTENKAEMSHSDVSSQLEKLIRGKKSLAVPQSTSDYVYITDCYDEYCVYSRGGKLFKQGYSVAEGKVKLSGVAQEVTRETRYKTADGKIVGNSTGEMTMDKTAVVDAILANAASGWTEDERDWLESLDEDKLGRIATNAKVDVEDMDEDEEEEDQADESTDARGNKKPTKGKAKDAVDATDPEDGAGNSPKESRAKGEKAKDQAKNCTKNGEGEEDEEVTVEEYVNNAPPQVREVLGLAINSLNAEKSKLVAAITANKSCDFTKEFLLEKPLEELRAIAKMAANSKPRRPVMFAGDAAPVENADAGEVPVLDSPTMNFGKEDEKDAA